MMLVPHPNDYFKDLAIRHPVDAAVARSLPSKVFCHLVFLTYFGALFGALCLWFFGAGSLLMEGRLAYSIVALLIPPVGAVYGAACLLL